MESVGPAAVTLQNALDALDAWGRQWRISFEPAKSQTMTIDFHRQPWATPAVQFSGSDIQEESQLKLLGVTFDSQLSHRQHLRTVALRARQRLGLLRKASSVLDSRSRVIVYHGFVRPVMEYCPLVWMGAADCHLKRLDRTQRSALHLIGNGALLQSLSIRRMVAACTYLYKLLCSKPDSPLRQLIPPSQALRPANVRPTRLSLARLDMHPYQLETGLTVNCRESCRRAFPACAVPVWNSLPQTVLSQAPDLKRLQSFKTAVFRHIRAQRWLWATDML